MILFFYAFIFSSCQKDEENAALITVKNSNGNLVKGAKVVLHTKELSNSIKNTVFTDYDSFDSYLSSSPALISQQGIESTVFNEQWTDDNGQTEHVFEKEMILNVAVIYIDGNDIYVDDRTIDSHIKRLRKKFRQFDSKFDQIRTRYGLGYSWRE